MALTQKEIKSRHFKRKYEAAPWTNCACGCGTAIKSLDKYARPKKFVNGHNGRKYKDPTQYKIEWNHRNRKSRYSYKIQYCRKRRVKLLLLKGGKCVECRVPYDGTNACMFHFHHLDPKKKLFNFNDMTRSWNKILKEADKCDMLCANCHEKKHSEEY